MAKEFYIKDLGGIINLKSYLKKTKNVNYETTSRGFSVRGEKGTENVYVIIKNESFRAQAEREIRKNCNLPELAAEIPLPFNPVIIEQKQLEPPKPTIEQKEKEMIPSKKIEQKLTVSVTIAPTYIAFSLPTAFDKMRFSAVHIDGQFLISPDQDGVLCSKNGETARITFARGKWFKGLNFPQMSSAKVESRFDADKSIVVDFDYAIPVQAVTPPLEFTKQTNKIDTESPRDKAKRYIDWLNDFAAKNDYSIKSENNRLRLERNDQIG